MKTQQQRKKDINKHSGEETCTRNPRWIKKVVPASYADDDLKRIVLFYVINTPCTDLSASGIALTEYGWQKDVWKGSKLRYSLSSVAHLEKNKSFFVSKKTKDIKQMLKNADMRGKFFDKREKEKVAFFDTKNNEFMSVLYHIRNALAHGRLAMYDIKNSSDLMFALESVKPNGNDNYVRARMILKKSTLLRWIDILERKGQI